ncbi:MAG TPA: thioredoxin domain-containing protein [Thermoanaerobaculia bacterium]
MKRLVLLLVFATAVFGQQAQQPDGPPEVKVTPPPAFEKYIREAMPVCDQTTLSYIAMVHKLPENLSGLVVRASSPRQACEEQMVGVTSREGTVYLGIPWFLDDVKDVKGLEQKLTEFTATALHEQFTPVIDKAKPTKEGLFTVTLYETTERGKLPLYGEIDPAGTVFFIGPFRPFAEAPAAARVKAFEQYIADSPATGAAKPEVTVVEFSDFECPSCQHAAGYMKSILEKHADKVRYIRFDTPLVTMHPWAFSAALAGRAVWHQKPEAFWDYKKQVYENQDKLNSFTIEDFARGFAKDHELDLKRYDDDVASETLKTKIINGVGTAFSNDIRATPTYMVNGVIVDAGTDGKDLAAYVESLLKK